MQKTQPFIFICYIDQVRLTIFLILALLASCAPTLPYNPDSPIQIGETWEMIARGHSYTFSLNRQTSSAQAAQLKFFTYEGTDSLGNTVEMSSLIKKVMTVRIFSKPNLNQNQLSAERAVVCRAVFSEGKWLGRTFEGTLIEEADAQTKALNQANGAPLENDCELHKVG